MSVTDYSATEPETAPEAPQGGSALSVLQRKRAELAKRGTREKTCQVPLWEGVARVVYQYPEAGADPIIRAVERAQAATAQDKRSEAAFNANADVLIACCHDVQFRDPDGDNDWASMVTPGPIRFTKRLADAMGLDLPESLKSPARFIVRNLFSPKAADTGVYEGDISLMTQAGQVIQWLNAAEESADEALRGE